MKFRLRCAPPCPLPLSFPFSFSFFLSPSLLPSFLWLLDIQLLQQHLLKCCISPIGLLLHLSKQPVGHTCVGPISVPVISVSVPLPASHSPQYCSYTINLLNQIDSSHFIQFWRIDIFTVLGLSTHDMVYLSLYLDWFLQSEFCSFQHTNPVHVC